MLTNLYLRCFTCINIFKIFYINKIYNRYLLIFSCVIEQSTSSNNMDDSSSSKLDTTQQNISNKQQIKILNSTQQSVKTDDSLISIGHLLYQMSALLSLQNLYAIAIQEIAGLKAQLEKQEKRFLWKTKQWSVPSSPSEVTQDRTS